MMKISMFEIIFQNFPKHHFMTDYSQDSTLSDSRRCLCLAALRGPSFPFDLIDRIKKTRKGVKQDSTID